MLFWPGYGYVAGISDCLPCDELEVLELGQAGWGGWGCLSNPTDGLDPG